jgi:CIC family chloride channel protein
MLHLLLGDEPLFHVPPYQLVHPLEFGVYAVLGIAGGLVSTVFVKLLLGMRAWFLARPQWTQWFLPVAGGLVVGVMGWFVPQSLGIGYQYVGQALNGDMALKAMLLLGVLRLISTTTCYASGNAGGIFGPSLFIGAMLGGAIGSVAHAVLPQYTAPAGAYALVGMGTAFAGIVRVPLTSVIMIFEVTRDYSIIVPLMISNLISFFISYRLQREPIYEALCSQDGIHLPSGGSHARHGILRVESAMRRDVEPFSPRATAAAALENLRQVGAAAWPVADGDDLIGMITAVQLESAVGQGASNRPLAQILTPATGLGAHDFPHVHADHSLDIALQRMGAMHLDVLPVVRRDNPRRLVGIVTPSDVLHAFGIERSRAAG